MFASRLSPSEGPPRRGCAARSGAASRFRRGAAGNLERGNREVEHRENPLAEQREHRERDRGDKAAVRDDAPLLLRAQALAQYQVRTEDAGRIDHRKNRTDGGKPERDVDHSHPADGAHSGRAYKSISHSRKIACPGADGRN